MAVSHFHRMLEAKILEVIEARNKDISARKCTDWGHYQYECGFVYGLNYIIDLANDMEKESN